MPCFPFVLFSSLNIFGQVLRGLGSRARELFYYLKGGQVDYGEEHSKACGHSQFGRIYEQGLTKRPPFTLFHLHVVSLMCLI